MAHDKNEFNIDDYSGKYVMVCESEDEAASFCRYLHSKGRTWSNGESYIDDSCWANIYSKIYYYFNEGVYDCVYMDDDYELLYWKDFTNYKPISSISLHEALLDIYNRSMFNPIAIYINDIWFWGDTEDFKQFKTFDACWEDFKSNNINYDKMFVKCINIVITNLHHSIVKISCYKS